MRLWLILALGLATPVAAEVPKVVTDFGPIQSLVMDVMGDLGTPTALLPTGGDPHDFQLRPSQAQMLAGADLVFWDGPELIPALSDALTSLAPQAEVVSLLHDSGGRVREFADGGVDPHGWLDPTNGIVWAGKIAEALSAKDPDNAAVYTANAMALQSAIATLDLDLMAQLTPLQNKPFVVYHDALGYFIDHYGLDVAGAIELGDASSPSAARLAEIKIADYRRRCGLRLSRSRARPEVHRLADRWLAGEGGAAAGYRVHPAGGRAWPVSGDAEGDWRQLRRMPVPALRRPAPLDLCPLIGHDWRGKNGGDDGHGYHDFRDDRSGD